MDNCTSCGREVSTDEWGTYSSDGRYYCGHCCDMALAEEKEDE